MSNTPLEGVRLAITGADGFVGRHLVKLANAAGATVLGVSRNPEPGDILRSLLSEYHSVDLRHEWPEGLSADVVVHLAGRAAVGPSFSAPQEYIADNSAMTTTLCEAMLANGGAGRVIGVSTGAVYAPPVHAQTTIAEQDPLLCASPYVVSKLLVENQLAYYRTRGLETVVVRPFNHIGPGQGPGFLIPDLIHRLNSLKSGEPLVVGNLATARDYTDVRDIAAAYLMLAAAPQLEHKLYNVASGSALTGEQILEAICAGFKRDVPELIQDTVLFRPTDIPRITGSADRLRNEFGWAPKFSLESTIADAIHGIGL